MKFKYISTLFALFLLWGCTNKHSTAELWSTSTYTENINQFLINPEDNSLIIIGEKYHYIFNDDSVSSDILVWSGRKNLSVSFYSFKVNSENIVTGTYSLLGDSEEASIKDINWLKEHGFKIYKNGLYTKTLNVRGTRYLAGNTEVGNSDHLNKQYRITIKKPHNSTFETTYKTILTPITITGDSIPIIGGVTLLIIAVPFVAVNGIIDSTATE